jgi:hypothetical protein
LKVQVPSAWIATQRIAPERKRGPKDRRLPVIGTVLSRTYRDQTVEVKVLTDGFEYQGRHYGSLSAIAPGMGFAKSRPLRVVVRSASSAACACAEAPRWSAQRRFRGQFRRGSR